MLYESRGRQELRNVREPVELVAAVPLGAATAPRLAIDPVCHMAVDPDRPAGRLVYEGTAYFFCTLACAGDFARRPERFTERAEAAQAQRVGDDRDAREPHRGAGDQRVEQAGGGQRDRGDVVAEGPRRGSA